MKKLLNVSLIIIQSIVLVACSTSTPISTTASSKKEEPVETEEVTDDTQTGQLDLENKLYTETFNYYSEKYSDCSFEITFQLITSDEESNSSKLFINDVKFNSIQNVIGWDDVEFKDIESIEYEDNNQQADVYFTYNVSKDGDTFSEKGSVSIDLNS